MTGQEALRRATATLRAKGIEDAEAEAGILLRHALHQDRVFMYVHLPEQLTEEQERAFLDILSKRLQRRPAAYLTGVREFYGIEFYVAPGVLIPRPETELLVEESLRLLRARAGGSGTPVFVDVGTGSGAVVASVAKNFAAARYFGIDVSSEALQVAALNCKRPRLAGRIELLRGDLLDPLPVVADVIAANPPYISTPEWQLLPPEIRDYEPRQALDGGDDGLNVIRRLIQTAPGHLAADGALLLEVGNGQAPAVLDLLGAALPESDRYALRDLAGIERVVVANRTRALLPNTRTLG
jgi:release factor glutamine methyltransferase